MHKKVMGVEDDETQRMGDLSGSDSPLSDDEESDVEGAGTAAVLHTGISDEMAAATGDSLDGATAL